MKRAACHHKNGAIKTLTIKKKSNILDDEEIKIKNLMSQIKNKSDNRKFVITSKKKLWWLFSKNVTIGTKTSKKYIKIIYSTLVD